MRTRADHRRWDPFRIEPPPPRQRAGTAPKDSPAYECGGSFHLIVASSLTAPISVRRCFLRVLLAAFGTGEDRVHFFELRLVELPELRLDDREIIAARLTSPSELHSMVLTGSVTAYLSRANRPADPEPS